MAFRTSSTVTGFLLTANHIIILRLILCNIILSSCDLPVLRGFGTRAGFGIFVAFLPKQPSLGFGWVFGLRPNADDTEAPPKTFLLPKRFKAITAVAGSF
jgi:hypothetical protein